MVTGGWWTGAALLCLAAAAAGSGLGHPLLGLRAVARFARWMPAAAALLTVTAAVLLVGSAAHP